MNKKYNRIVQYMRIFINPKITKKINFPQVKGFSHTKEKKTAQASFPPLTRQLHTKLPPHRRPLHLAIIKINSYFKNFTVNIMYKIKITHVYACE